jgi:hypothetical protein
VEIRKFLEALAVVVAAEVEVEVAAVDHRLSLCH